MCIYFVCVCVCKYQTLHCADKEVLTVKCLLGSLYTVKDHKMESYATPPQSQTPVALYEYLQLSPFVKMALNGQMCYPKAWEISAH